LEFITNVKCLRWIDLCLFAGPEVDGRSRFLDPFLPTDQDRVEEREYLESIECLEHPGIVIAHKTYSYVELFQSINYARCGVS